jgi:hypothetical protein
MFHSSAVRYIGAILRAGAGAGRAPSPAAQADVSMTDEQLQAEIEKMRKELAEEVPAAAPAAEKKAGA